MDPYALLAEHYDRLVAGVEYARWVNFIDFHGRLLGSKPRIVDIGCGTGTVTLGLAQRGYDVLGLDFSSEMLAIANEKANRKGISLNLVNAPLQELNLGSNMFISTCDGINHIVKPKEVIGLFKNVYRLLEPGGLFIFDINSQYKFEKVLAQNIFTFKLPDLDLYWENDFSYPFNRSMITMYKRTANNQYLRTGLEIRVRCYPLSTLLYYLRQCGFDITGLWDNYKKPYSPSRNIDRITVVAKKS